MVRNGAIIHERQLLELPRRWGVFECSDYSKPGIARKNMSLIKVADALDKYQDSDLYRASL